MSGYLFLLRRNALLLLLACIAITTVVLRSPVNAAAADAELTCAGTPDGDKINLVWTRSPESPTVHIRQVLEDDSTKWRATSEATMATLPDFAFGIDARYIVRYRIAGEVVDARCNDGPLPPPPPVTSRCIQVSTGHGDDYLSWEAQDRQKTSIRRGTVEGSKWVETTRLTHGRVTSNNKYVVRIDGADHPCEQLLEIDPDPDFSCTTTPRFTTLSRLAWSGDSEAKHQVRFVNVQAFEDQFFRTQRDGTVDVPSGRLYFIRRETGDTPCLPPGIGDDMNALCSLNGQPRSLQLDAANCAALTELIEAGVLEQFNNPCQIQYLNCKDNHVTQISIDLRGADVPEAIGDLPGLKKLVLLNGTGTLPQSIVDAPLYDLTLGGDIDLPDLGELRALSRVEFIGSIPQNNLDTITTKNVFVSDLVGEVPSNLAGIDTIKRLTIEADSATAIPPGLIADTLTELRISGTNITGTLPNLNNLRVLDLSDTAFSGSIPSSYATSDLTELNLANTNISGSLPNFGLAPKLVVLNVGNAMLTGPIPSGIGESPSLVDIDLSRNALTGPVPDELANIDSLRNLDLRKNSLTGSLPANFGRLSVNFETLDLSGNEIAGPIPDSWAGLTGNPRFDGFSHFEIDLANNLLTGPLPEFTGSGIVLYDLRENRIVGDITQAARHGFEEKINFRWSDGAGGNDCLTVTHGPTRDLLDATQVSWSICD